jgi:hypothetical protein
MAALYGPLWSNSAAAVGILTDKYANLTRVQFDLITTADELTDAEDRQAKALKEGNAPEFNKQSQRVWLLKEKYAELIIEMNKIPTATRDMFLDFRELTNVTIPNLTKELAAARMTGVAADIEAANIALKRATNSANDFKKALGPAAQTYNTMFASSLQAGGIGPDWAGFSDMANWSIEDLIKAAGGDFAMTGGSQNRRERAQAYLARMQTGGTTGAGGAIPDKKSVSIAGQSTIDTGTIDKELNKQGVAYTTLNEKIVKGWGDLEGQGLVHYTAMSELSRIRTQAELEYMTEAVNFGGTHPIVQNKIIMSATGPDWTPPAFTALTAPSLKAADFSGVKIVGGGQKPAAPEKGNVTVTQNIKITNNGVKTDAEGMNKSLGKLAALGGGLP